MRDRVFGVETEYAVIYHPGRGDRDRPTNFEIYQLFEPRLAASIKSLPRAFSLLRAKQGRFLENGSSFHYEATPQDFEHGLIEMASPECRDPFVLLRYERAKDRLVERLVGDVNLQLARQGYTGEVRIGKNNVDSQGHTFGSHESYWVDDPLPPGRKLALLPVWIGSWLLSLPVFGWLLLAFLGILAGSAMLVTLPVAAGLSGALAAALGRVWSRPARRLSQLAHFLLHWPMRMLERMRRHPGELARKLAWIEAPLRPVIAIHSWIHRAFHFQRFQRDLTAFLVTRTLFCGAGAVSFDGRPPLRMAQRPPFLRSLARVFTSGEDRPLYESRDLFFRPWSALLRRRRLHLLLGDANLCDWAQVLRTGTTALVLEAIESGRPADWPVLADPLSALQHLNQDTTLTEELVLVGGGRATAVEIQRRFLEGVRQGLDGDSRAAARPATDWKLRVLAMWEETLDLLECDPEALADRVDWIAKRALLRREVTCDADWEALERRGASLLRGPVPEDEEDFRLRELAFRTLRTDLRYHELGHRGGHRRLERRGRVRQLVSDAEVSRARTEPPPDTRAHPRGRAIREASARRVSGAATWHRVRLGALDWRWWPDPLDPDPR